MKYIATVTLLLLFTFPSLSQKIFHTRVDKTDINLRGTAVVIAQIEVVAPSAGKVMVRFDGDCISSPGDKIIIAASKTPNWGTGDNSIFVKAMSNDLNSNVFCHTRVYDVSAGVHTFYAVAQNYAETPGTGIASLYGSFTAEWFPEISGQAFVQHKGIIKEDFNVEGAPVVLATQTINTPVSGKVIVRFDGLCKSSDGDLIFLAANDSPTWGSNEGSSSIEIPDDEFNTNSFSHIKTFDVTPGEHTYYAVIENYYEVYGNGIASVYGSLTTSFYPNQEEVQPVNMPIVQIGAIIDNGPANLGELVLNTTKAGKVLLNFSGTCIGSFGDYIKLAANDSPTWGPHDGSFGFEPFSSDRNRTSFSHTRMFDVGAGEHHYYAVAENVNEFFGSGLVVVYGNLTATFFPQESVSSTEPDFVQNFRLAPNPGNDVVSILTDNLDGKAINIQVYDEKGSLVKSFYGLLPEADGKLNLSVASLQAGNYFIKIEGESLSGLRKFQKL